MASPWLDELNLGIPVIHDMLRGLLSRVLEKPGLAFGGYLGCIPSREARVAGWQDRGTIVVANKSGLYRQCAGGRTSGNGQSTFAPADCRYGLLY